MSQSPSDVLLGSAAICTLLALAVLLPAAGVVRVVQFVKARRKRG
jgi:hypothetical protein